MVRTERTTHGLGTTLRHRAPATLACTDTATIVDGIGRRLTRRPDGERSHRLCKSARSSLHRSTVAVTPVPAAGERTVTARSGRRRSQTKASSATSGRRTRTRACGESHRATAGGLEYKRGSSAATRIPRAAEHTTAYERVLHRSTDIAQHRPTGPELVPLRTAATITHDRRPVVRQQRSAIRDVHCLLRERATCSRDSPVHTFRDDSHAAPSTAALTPASTNNTIYYSGLNVHRSPWSRHVSQPARRSVCCLADARVTARPARCANLRLNNIDDDSATCAGRRCSAANDQRGPGRRPGPPLVLR